MCVKVRAVDWMKSRGAIWSDPQNDEHYPKTVGGRKRKGGKIKQGEGKVLQNLGTSRHYQAGRLVSRRKQNKKKARSNKSSGCNKAKKKYLLHLEPW